MWLFSRILLLLSLTACGFTPAYGPAGSAKALRGSVEVDAPNTRNGFHLVRRLEERLGQPNGAKYALSYTLKLSENALAITPAQEITRYNVLGMIDYSIADQSGTILHSGRVDSFTSYSATGTTVSTAAAKRDAYERLMIILADQTTSRLIATSPSWAR